MAIKRKPTAKAKARHPGRSAKGATANDLPLPSGYPKALEDIKDRVRAARIRASLSVNRELIILYWEMGRLILQRQEAEGWGAKAINAIVRTFQKRTAAGLQSGRDFVIPDKQEQATESSDFELITWLVIKSGRTDG
jgi:hypothetical protein